MKSHVLVIAASLCVNAGLLGWIALRPSSGAMSSPASEYNSRRGSAPATESEPALPASTVPPAPDAPPPETWNRLQSTDLATFVANLRAAGLPDRQVRMLVNAEINERFRAREEAVRPSRPSRNYWEPGDTYYNDPTTLEQRLAQLDLRREKAALRRELLGETPRAADDNNPVPPGKRDLLREINEDYNTMISQIQRETRGISLASDEEKIRYLRAEKEAELKTLLSPEELREYEIRSSSTANNLRSDLAAFGPTEQEFRSLFALRKQFDDQFPSQPADPGPDYWTKRQEAQKALDAQIAQQLGADRARDYARAKDHEYRNLATLTHRLGLPQETASQIYDLRYSVPTDAAQIANNKALTPEDRKASLKAIAQKTRDQLVTQLGAEAAEAYLKHNGQWIKSLERGQVIEYKADGTQHTHQISP
ncbi:MAG: hypothetical protein K0R17_375 [Rariglobus sp.]|jgi:hypothetical protein|nr:hypothetical protein [Rariglobus sp.]